MRFFLVIMLLCVASSFAMQSDAAEPWKVRLGIKIGNVVTEYELSVEGARQFLSQNPERRHVAWIHCEQLYGKYGRRAQASVCDRSFDQTLDELRAMIPDEK